MGVGDYVYGSGSRGMFQTVTPDWWKTQAPPQRSLMERAWDKAYEIERSKKRKDGSYDVRNLDLDAILRDARRIYCFLRDGKDPCQSTPTHRNSCCCDECL